MMSKDADGKIRCQECPEREFADDYEAGAHLRLCHPDAFKRAARVEVIPLGRDPHNGAKRELILPPEGRSPA